MTTILRPSSGVFSQTDYRRFVGDPVVSAEQISYAKGMIDDIQFANVSDYLPFMLDDNCKIAGRFLTTAHALAKLSPTDAGSLFIKTSLLKTSELKSASVLQLAQHRGAIDHINRLIADGRVLSGKIFAYIKSTNVIEWIGRQSKDSRLADTFEHIIMGFPEYFVSEISVYSNAVEIRLVDKNKSFDLCEICPDLGYMSAVVNITKYGCSLRCAPSIYVPRKKSPFALVMSPLSKKISVYDAMDHYQKAQEAVRNFKPKPASKKLKIQRLVPYINLLVQTLAKSLAANIEDKITDAHYIVALMSIGFQDGRPRLLCERAAYDILEGRKND